MVRRRRRSGLRRTAIIAGAVIVLAGVIGLAYPAVGGYINRLAQGRTVEHYRRLSEQLAVDGGTEVLLRQAHEYNQWIYSRSGGLKDLDETEMDRYNGMLSISETGIMGYLEIPSINVSLPIYHGTEEAVLQAGIGHLAGSSLPVGGENTHAVLTGHSGIPASRLLTDLDQLRTGDLFTVTVLDHTVAYAVDDIQVVKPEDASFLIEEGTDRCTLVTCTPIGVNTHRLLVRGSRTEQRSEPEPEPEQDALQAEEESRNFMPYILIIGAIMAVIVILIFRIHALHGRKR